MCEDIVNIKSTLMYKKSSEFYVSGPSQNKNKSEKKITYFLNPNQINLQLE